MGLNLGLKVKTSAVVAVLFIVIFGAMGGSLFENVPVTDIIVNQNLSGKMEVYKEAGIEFQALGSLTSYAKSSQYWFSKDSSEGGVGDDSFAVKFNDNGMGYVSGSARIDLPRDQENILKLHERFGSMYNVKNDLIRQIIRKAVLASGALMSSKDAITTERNAFIAAIEDQAVNGIYDTVSETFIEKDSLTGNEITRKVVTILKDPTAPKGLARKAASPFTEFGIKMRVNVSGIIPSEKVAAQLEKQQSILMKIQEGKANVLLAEQNKLTAKREGEAAAETAKWSEERNKIVAETRAEKEASVDKINAERESTVAKINAEKQKTVATINANREIEVARLEKERAEVAANQRFQVARLNKKASEQNAAAKLVGAKADAEANRLKVKAGATPQERLAADVAKNADKWAAIGRIKLPTTVIGGSTGGGKGNSKSGMAQFIELLVVDKAQKLSNK